MAPPSAAEHAPAYDVFNGDADGICALHQLRLAQPRAARLITGVKRDIALLQQVPCEASIDVTVLDVSLDANADALRRILAAGGRVTYFDHHSARQAFTHPALQLMWSDACDVCTSLLVDRHVGGRFRHWAIVAAFGDNLAPAAQALAAEAGLSADQTCAMDELGCLINYNASGECIDDLHIAPDALYRAIRPFADPFAFMAESPLFRRLALGYRDDMAHTAALMPVLQWAAGAIYVLPDAPWARRVSGVFANQLAATRRASSFAVLTACPSGAYVVSVRSGAPDACAADHLCTRFPTGGGRRAAAGINVLPAAELDAFIAAFSDHFAVHGTPRHSQEDSR